MHATETHSRKNAGQKGCSHNCLKCKCSSEKITLKGIAKLFDRPNEAFRLLSRYSRQLGLGALDLAKMEMHFQTVRWRRCAQGIRPAMPTQVIEEFFAELAASIG